MKKISCDCSVEAVNSDNKTRLIRLLNKSSAMEVVVCFMDYFFVKTIVKGQTFKFLKVQVTCTCAGSWVFFPHQHPNQKLFTVETLATSFTLIIRNSFITLSSLFIIIKLLKYGQESAG